MVQRKKAKKVPFWRVKLKEKWRRREARGLDDGDYEEKMSEVFSDQALSPSTFILNTRLEDGGIGSLQPRIKNEYGRQYQHEVEQLSKEPSAARAAGEKALWSEKRQRWQSAGLALLSAAASLGGGSKSNTLRMATATAEALRAAAMWRSDAEAYNKNCELEALNLEVDAARHAENLDIEHRRHLHDLTGGLRSAGSESERDMWEQRLSRQQSLTTVASLLFAAGVALIVEGDLPNSAADKNIFGGLPLLDSYYFVTALGLGMLLFVVVGGVKLSNWLNAFMFKRVAFYNDFLDVRLRIKYSTLRSILRKPSKSRGAYAGTTGLTTPGLRPGNDRLRDEITDLLNQRVCMLREKSTQSADKRNNNKENEEDYVVTFSKWYEMECASFSHCIDKAFHIGTFCVMIGLSIFVWARLDHRDPESNRKRSRTAASLFVFTVALLLVLVFAAPRFVRKFLDRNEMRLVCCTGIRYVRPAVYSLGQVHDRVEDLFDLIRDYARKCRQISPLDTSSDNNKNTISSPSTSSVPATAPSHEYNVQFADVLAALDPETSPIYEELQRGLLSEDLDASLPDVTKIFIDALRRSFPSANIELLEKAVHSARNAYLAKDNGTGATRYGSARRNSNTTNSNAGRPYSRSNTSTILRQNSPAPLVDADLLERNLENALFFAHQRSATRLDYTLQDDDKQLFSIFPDNNENLHEGAKGNNGRLRIPSLGLEDEQV